MGVVAVDLPVDLQSEDDSGLPWGLMPEAREPGLIAEGRWIVVGSQSSKAVAQVVEIEGDVVRVRVLPGPVSRHVALLPHVA